MNGKAHVARNFIYLVENEGLLKVAESHNLFKFWEISDRPNITSTVPMFLNDLEGRFCCLKPF